MNILVSGIASDIGLNIGRILRRTGWDLNLIGCDIHAEYYASDIFHETHVIPRASSPDYINALEELVKSRNIDIFIPSSEAELRWIMENQILINEIDVKVIKANQNAMEVGFDKLITAKYLEGKGLNSPWTELVSDYCDKPPEIPCIIKSRTGAGNSSVHFVDTFARSSEYAALFPSYIWQEFLSGDEYTCGVYRCRDKSVRVIAMRRRLSAGVSVYTQVVRNNSIDMLCRIIAESLDLFGSINVQLRMVNGKKPVVFEINPRFSSTINMRDQIGFQDLVWSIQEQWLDQKASPEPEFYPEVSFSRRYEEVMIP